VIARLCGRLLEKDPPTLLIDVNGVGYEVVAPLTTCLKLPELSSMVTLYTHLSIREDAHQLYGFNTRMDRELFRELIRVNSVGPKLALAVLSSMDASVFIAKVTAQDIAGLVAVPGVGRKTAERLLIEMRDRLGKWPTQTMIGLTEPKEQTLIAMQALVRLGYKPQEVEKAIHRFGHEAENSEQLILKVLQGFGQAKV